MRVLPTLDQYADQKVSPALSRVLDVKGCEQFVASHPEYFASEHNHAAIRKWLAVHRVPWSLRNIEVAFSELSKDGALEARPEITNYKVTKIPLTAEEMGVQKILSGLVLRHSTGGIAENQLVSERPERMAELLGATISEREAQDAENRNLAGKVGQPISKQMRVKYQQSLGANQKSKRDNPYSERFAEARACVGLNCPELKIGSPAYNKKVADLLAESKN